MRQAVAPQLSLVLQIGGHAHARELARISEILDWLPQSAELIARDREELLFLVARRDGSEPPQVVKEDLDRVTLAIERSVEPVSVVLASGVVAGCR
jgi:hypothetical protein